MMYNFATTKEQLIEIVLIACNAHLLTKLMLLMKKVYTAFAAAMIATASFAQPLAKPKVQGPFANGPLKYQSMMKPTGKVMDFMKPNSPSNVVLSSRVKKAAADSDFITEQPAGTLHENLYGSGEGYLVFWGYIMATTIDGTVEQYVEGDNGEVYLKNALGTIASDAWIKGEKTVGDTIQFNFPQKYYAQEATDDDGNPTGETEYFYLYRSNYVKTEDGATISPDPDSQTIKYVLRNDSLIRVDNYDNNVYLALCTKDGGWTGYADYYQTWSKLKDAASVPPASADVSKYQINYYNADGQEDAKIIDVAFDGSDVYFGGLNESAPDTWAKGKIDGDKAVFDGKIYMGVDKENGVHTFFSALGSEKVYDSYYDQDVDSFYFEKSIAFDYDAAAKTLKSDGMFNVNSGLNSVYTLALYEEPQLKAWKEIPGAPKDPEMLQFMAYDDGYGYGAFQVWLENTTEEGNLLDVDKLFYNVYIDGEKFTFYPDEYTALKDEITDVPYNFTDSWDFYASGNARTIYYYVAGFSKIGFQEVYRSEGKEYKSNLVEYEVDDEGNFTPIETGINKTAFSAGSENVKSVSFTDLSGRRVSKLANGVYLKTMKMADGSQKTVKIVKK